MKRILLAAAVLFALASPAFAATYILNADGTVTAQTVLPATEAAPGCICGPDCACKPGVCPGGCPVAAVAAPVAGHYEQQCTTDSRGRKSCRTVWVPDAPESTKGVTIAEAGPLVLSGNGPQSFPLNPVGAPATVSGDLFGFKMSATVDVPQGPLAKLRVARQVAREAREARGGLFSRLANRPRLFGRAGGGCASCGQ